MSADNEQVTDVYQPITKEIVFISKFWGEQVETLLGILQHLSPHTATLYILLFVRYKYLHAKSVFAHHSAAR